MSIKTEAIIVFTIVVAGVAILAGYHGSKAFLRTASTNAPPVLSEFRAVEYGESWNKHTYLIHDKYQWGAVLHAEHCRGYHPNFIIVTNITYVTLTNTLTEIPDEVWKRYEELRRK